MFVSASVTCFFAPKIGEPRHSGSLGVGFTIDKGVNVKLSRKGFKFNNEDLDIPTVRYVIDSLGYDGGINVESDLPLGCGFGLSSATALATALEINEKLGLNRSLFQIADLVHEAEVLNKTGLGDVTTQCYGGFVVRKVASCPSRCLVDRYLWNVEVDFLIMDKMKTEGVLEGNLKTIYERGKRALKDFIKNPTIENLFAVSKEFALSCGFVDDKVMDAIEAVESYGGYASMIMLGKGVFAIKGEILKDFRGVYMRSKVVACGIRV